MPGAETRAPDLQGWLLPRERALAKLRAGRPLLHDEPLELDLEPATDRFLQFAAHRQMQLPRLDLSALLTEAFVQHADHVRQIASGPKVDAESIAELAEQAVRPLRRAYADRLRAFVHEWARGYCLICGASPGQAGLVECAACGCEWHAAAVEPAFRIELAVPDEDA
jgi:hypothetical protein